MSSELGYAVFIAEPIRQNATDMLPNGDRPMWSPLSTTLIHGPSDAVLVDPPFTRDQAHAVGDWVQASNKNLTRIFATHGHGDHWFTAGIARRAVRRPNHRHSRHHRPDAPQCGNA
jgi:glyoxylase-like metal-dependent hydrolase (beta-lactamase superfamily II)